MARAVKRMIALRLDPQVLEEFDAEARKRGHTNRTAYIERWMRVQLAKWKAE